MCKSAQFITQICEKPWDQSRGCILQLAGEGGRGKTGWTQLADASLRPTGVGLWSQELPPHEITCVSLSLHLSLSLCSQAHVPNRTRHSQLWHLSKQRMHYLQVGPLFSAASVSLMLHLMRFLFIYLLFILSPSPSTLLDHHDSGRASALVQWRLSAQNDVTVFPACGSGELEGWKDENKVFWADGWLNVQPLTVMHVNYIEHNVSNHIDLKWNIKCRMKSTFVIIWNSSL